MFLPCLLKWTLFLSKSKKNLNNARKDTDLLVYYNKLLSGNFDFIIGNDSLTNRTLRRFKPWVIQVYHTINQYCCCIAFPITFSNKWQMKGPVDSSTNVNATFDSALQASVNNRKYSRNKCKYKFM